MAFTLDAITYTNPITGGTTDWLCANVGDSITINQTISVSEYVLCSTENTWTLNNTDGYIGAGWLTGGDFSNFKVGDSITLYNYRLLLLDVTGTIVAKQSDSEIQLSSTGGYGNNLMLVEHVLSITNPVTALTYKWNFIENNEALNFFSKVDGSVQMATITGLNAAGAGTNKPMTFIGALPYQIGSIVVDEISLATTPIYKSTFKIKHTTKITPIMLAEQWDDILNGIAPDYYFNLNCLKSVFEYEARYLLNDPNDVQTLQIEDIQGNSGWFNENFNTKLTKYYVENLAYTKTSDASSIDSIELTTSDTTGFSFIVRNTTSTPFVENSTKIILNFCKAPNSSDEYSANGRNMQDNFVWETVTLTANTVDTLVNGDNYGTSKLQSLKSCNCNFDSTSSLTISGLFEFLTDGFNVFNESNEPRYLFFVSICNHSLTASVSDRVSLLVDASAFYFKTVYADLITTTTKVGGAFENYIESSGSTDQYTEDENKIFGRFEVNPTYLGGGNTLLINRIGVKLEMVNTLDTSKRFTLDTYSFNVSGQPYVGDLQYFDLNVNSLINSVTISRQYIRCYYNTTANTFDIEYPYLNRWEYWESLLNVNSAFFDNTEPNNGYNHDWFHYNIANWEVVATSYITIKYNGVTANYSNTFNYTIKDRNLTSPNFTFTLETLDKDTLLPLTNVLGYKDTLIRATVVNPNIYNDYRYSLIIGFDAKEGGRSYKTHLSNYYYYEELNTKLKDFNTYSDYTTVEKITGECLIDFTKLDLEKKDYKITARWYISQYDGPIDITYFEGNLKSIERKLIAKSPFDEVVEVITPEKIDCCSDLVWKVFHGNTDLKNDKNSFIWFYDIDAISSVTLKLVCPDLTELTLDGSTLYGTPYDYGDNLNAQNESAVGYLIDWKKVFDETGLNGTYYIKCTATSIFSATQVLNSDVYCLSAYSEDKANGTVRIEYYNRGIVGSNVNDAKFTDYGSLNWYNSHRFDGSFAFNNATYKTEETQYTNGQLEVVEDEQTPEYLLSLKPIAMNKHNVIRTDILMSDKILITDYNKKNIETYYQKNVKKIGSYDPKWYPLRSKLSSLDLKFKQGFNNLKKFRS